MTTSTEIERFSPNYNRLILWVIGGFGLGLLLIAGIRYARGYPLFTPYQPHGTVLQAPSSVGNFQLTTHTGEQVTLHDFRDKVVLIYFGYTYCPDVCPTTLVSLNKAVTQLSEKQQAQVQVLMVSVDPERDNPELLGNYITRFNPDFIGLYGSPEQLAAAASPLGIYYQKQELTDSSSSYLVDHSATVALLDKRGQMRLVYPYQANADDIASDLRYFIRE